MDVDLERAAKIAALNDKFRNGEPLDIHVTSGAFRIGNAIHLMGAVTKYSSFNEDNDPYGEHDFGSLEWNGEKVFWKIDYYDQKLEYGEDPLSPNCRRLLTIMLASEY